MGGAQHGFGFLAGDAFGAQVHQHDVAFGATAHNAQTARSERFCHDACIGQHLLLVELELGLQCFLERHRFGGNHMHQRAALQAGEDGAVDGFLVLRLHQDDAATRATQALVGGAGDDVGMRHRVGVQPCGDQTSIVRHIDHEDRANVFGDFGKTFKINSKRISAGTGDDQFWLGFMGFAFHRVVVDGFVGIQAVAHHVEPFAAHVQRHAVGQVTAFGQAHAHDGVAGFQEGQENRFVGGRAAMGLHVGGFGAKDLFDAVNRQLFGNVDKLAATVITFAGVAFGIFVGELGTLRRHDGRRGVVFAGDQLDVVLLTLVFGLDGSKQLGIGLLDENIAVEHGSPKRLRACMPSMW